MPLTPADVRNVAFSKPSIGKRGYKEDEVDVFLDLVGAELARLIETNKDLLNKIERLDQQLRTAPTSTGPTHCPLVGPRPVRPPLPTPMGELISFGGDRNVQAVHVLESAQEIADRLTREAEAEADGMLGEARAKSEQLLSNARAKADGMVNEARIRAETILNDACTRAETLDRAAPADLMRTQQGFAAHHLIPDVSTTWAGLPEAVHMSVGNGSPDRSVTNTPGSGWQPAV